MFCRPSRGWTTHENAAAYEALLRAGEKPTVKLSKIECGCRM
jgi:hypothetical protein